MSEGVSICAAAVREELSVLAPYAFSYYDGISSCVNVRVQDTPDVVVLEVSIHSLEVYGYFRDKNAVRICRNAASECRVSSVTPEHLDDHDSVVGRAGSLEVVDDCGDLVDGRVAAY